MAEPIDKDTRGPVNLRIKFRSESLQQFIERYGVDVSRGGIFIRTREPLPVGTRLKLDFQLVDTAPLFQGDGTVVWIREHDASRAGVTPGMGVRFDRLTPESQTTLDTILEEKIRLQQSGVAPGSIAKAGAGIAVRRPSGGFATLDAPGAKPLGPPPLPVQVKMDTPAAPSFNTPASSSMGASPASPMPASAARSGPLAAAGSSGSSSIFTRPRTTSGMRAVPVPSTLFEPPTADDIDKALSALEEKGGGPPSLPVAPTVINRSESKPIGDDDPTRVFDGSVAEEFSAHDAITGPATLVPENGVPVDTSEMGDGDLTERRSVDPASGNVNADGAGGEPVTARGHAAPPVPGAPGKPAPPLDAPLASLVDSGAAPPAKPAAPPLTKPSATPAISASGVPIRITTDRPTATESGRFRSDTRYKRKRGNGLTYALVILVVGGGVAGGGLYLKRMREKRVADAIAAAAAAPPLAAGQKADMAGVPGTETAPATAPAPGTGGAAATPPENTGAAPEAAGKTPAKPEEVVAKPDIKPEKPAKSAEKATAATDREKEKEGQPTPRSSSRRRDRSASAATETAAAKEKPAEAAGDKKPAGDEAKADTAKTTEAAKPAPGEKDEKSAEAAKPAEAAAAAPAAPPVLKITSSPAGADVVIDGVPVGTTPFSSKEITADATHAISVKKDGYEAHERMISGSDWSRGKGGVQSLKFNVKLRKTGGEQKPAEAAEKKKEPEVEILTPSEP